MTVGEQGIESGPVHGGCLGRVTEIDEFFRRHPYLRGNGKGGCGVRFS